MKTTTSLRRYVASLGSMACVLRKAKIRVRLIVAFAALALLVAAAVAAASIIVGLAGARQQALQQLESVAVLKEGELQTWVKDMQLDLDAMLAEAYQVERARSLLVGAYTVEFQADAETTLGTNLERVVDRGQRFDELFLIDPQGKVVLSTNAAREGRDESHEAYFERGLQESYVHPVSIDPVSGQASVFTARPLLDTFGDPVGVLAGRASLRRANEIMLERAGLGETGETYLVAANRVALTDLRYTSDGQMLTGGVIAAAAGQANGSGLYDDYRGVPVAGVYRWLPELQVALLAEQDQSDAFRAVRTALALNAGVAALSVLLAVVCSLFISRGIATPLANLARTATEIAAGNLDRAADVDREDEIGALAQAFNHMTARLREMLHNEHEQREHLQTTVQRYAAHMSEVQRGNLSARLALNGHGRPEDDPLTVLGRQLNETTASMQGMLGQVREAAGELGSAGTEILAATTQQASGANEQSAAIAQTTTTVDEVKVIAEQSMKRSQEVADVSARTVQVARTGQQAVQETIASMAQIKERVEGIAENILALSEQTQQIGEIIATVNDIAAQSNMLALNASVEAARAGEHGKGFSVVAVEVRNLAEQSRQATAQVKAILSDIQRATNASVMATEEGTKGVDVGVRLAGEAREAIGRLSAAIEESAQAALQMVAGGQQQASGIEQIALAMANINQATVQSLASTRQAEQTAQNLNELARNLSQAVESYQL
jgi:methyl-accepting chemotaxis protein